MGTFVLHGLKHNCGLMIIFNLQLDIKIQSIEKDRDGRAIFIKTIVAENELTQQTAGGNWLFPVSKNICTFTKHYQ